MLEARNVVVMQIFLCLAQKMQNVRRQEYSPGESLQNKNGEDISHLHLSCCTCGEKEGKKVLHLIIPTGGLIEITQTHGNDKQVY